MNYWIAPVKSYNIKSSESKINNVISDVCVNYNVTFENLKSKSRLANTNQARQVCQYILHRKLKITSTAVGKLFNRDHASVLHSVKKIQMFMEYEKELRERVSLLVSLHDNAVLDSVVTSTDEIMNKYINN